MNATKNELNKIATLLKKINASDTLKRNVYGILKYHSNFLEIYPNTIINGLSIGLALQNGAKNIVFISPMQSGKSGSIFFLNYVLSEIGFLKQGETILFLTSMRDKDLYEQNKVNMQQRYWDVVSNTKVESKIYVEKIDEIFKYPNPFQVVKERKVALFIRDEDQYGCGTDSTFDCGFLLELRNQLPDMPLLSVSATPFDILDSTSKGYPVTAIKGEVPDSYFGISDMLKLGLVENIEPSFMSYTFRTDAAGRTIFEISQKLNEYMRHLISFEDGIGIIRVAKSEDAFILRRITKNKYGKQFKSIVIGSDRDCDYNIAEGIKKVDDMVKNQKLRVFLIVVNALSAGKDFKSLKDKIRFGIETRKSQMANGAQGIPGRICGYHSNRNIKILASLPLLEKYCEFEEDWTVINNEEWRNDLQNLGIRNLSTQVKFDKTRKAGIYTPIVNSPFKLTYKQIKSAEGRKLLSFLDDVAYKMLFSAFKEEIWYEENSFRLKSVKSKATIRVASNYKPNDNRVYKLWNKYKVGDDFGDVMFKKKKYDWGLLISNIPVGKKSKSGISNEINFCGVEVYNAGNPILKNSTTLTDNHSMYLRA